MAAAGRAMTTGVRPSSRAVLSWRTCPPGAPGGGERCQCVDLWREWHGEGTDRTGDPQSQPASGTAFVPVNCGAIPETLLESELFGYAKGAFVGATQDHAGSFQAAHQGTLFLDEIGDMPLSLQVKLLRVLQERQVRPVGTTKSVSIDVRIISATHRSLEAEMQRAVSAKISTIASKSWPCSS